MTPEQRDQIDRTVAHHRAQSQRFSYGSLCDHIDTLLAEVERLEKERDAVIDSVIYENQDGGYTVGQYAALWRAAGGNYRTRESAEAAVRKAIGFSR